jgi:hypothetical protein
MFILRSVSGVWTFLLAILLGLGAGVVAFVLSEILWIALVVLALVLVLTVGLCQWVGA